MFLAKKYYFVRKHGKIRRHGQLSMEKDALYGIITAN